MMGGAAILRPSSLHIGTAAFARVPNASVATAMSVARRTLRVGGPRRRVTESGGSLARAFRCTTEPAERPADSSPAIKSVPLCLPTLSDIGTMARMHAQDIAHNQRESQENNLVHESALPRQL